MIASTSRGVGTTTVPSPHCFCIVGPIGTTLGKPLLWSNFSLQEDRFFVVRVLIGAFCPQFTKQGVRLCEKREYDAGPCQGPAGVRFIEHHSSARDYSRIVSN